MPAATVWKLDNLASVEGLKPQVLGAPKLAGEATGGPALEFNGESDGLLLETNPINGCKRFTVEALFLPKGNGPEAQRFLHIEDNRGGRLTLETRLPETNSWCLDAYLLCGEKGLALCDHAKVHPTDKWFWVALIYDGKIMSSYVNGAKELEGKLSFPAMKKGFMSLGVRLNRIYWFKGSLKELRFTPAALPPEALQRLP